MEESHQPLWLVGLRRFWAAGTALDRWITDHDVTGVVWTPASWVPDDAAPALIRLTESGAVPDDALLWDLAVTDIRDAADALRWTYQEYEDRDGLVAVWMDPERVVDPGRALSTARNLYEEVARENVAPAFAWTPARAGAVTAIVADGIPVALSGVRDEAAVTAVRRAWEKGMERARKDAEDLEDDDDLEDVTVFLLGGSGAVDEDDPIRPVALTTETAVVAQGRGAPPRLPLSAEAEKAGREDAVARLAARAARPIHEDLYEPEMFARGAGYRVDTLDRGDVLERLWARDHELWSPEPDEISDRLGWLDIAETMREQVRDLSELGRKVRASGVSHVVLCGMGGSSLAPETFHAILGADLPLTVLDTTHPDRIAEVRSAIDVDRTLFCISSKSGTTVETRSQLEYFWSLSGRGERFVAVTDPGTPLAALGRERGFLRVFENPPDIGGRYSGLSLFGLVPAALCGIDVGGVVDEALRMQVASAPSVPPRHSPGGRLGAALAEAAIGEDRDKLTFVLPSPLASFGAWVEQLIAESTGKDGKGMLPVDGEDLGPPERYGNDRVFVAYALGDEPWPEALAALEEAEHPVIRIRVSDLRAVAAEMYRWQIATAVLGHLLEIHPFDQPDVEAAKQRAREILDGAEVPEPEQGSAADLLTDIEPPSYIAIQAFVAPTQDTMRRLHGIRMRLRDRHLTAVTVGFGPRFLHSTGQFHKGGPDSGVFLQVTEPPGADVEIPGMPYTFGRLIGAQADGDLRALRDAERPAARLSLSELEGLI